MVQGTEKFAEVHVTWSHWEFALSGMGGWGGVESHHLEPISGTSTMGNLPLGVREDCPEGVPCTTGHHTQQELRKNTHQNQNEEPLPPPGSLQCPCGQSFISCHLPG